MTDRRKHGLITVLRLIAVTKCLTRKAFTNMSTLINDPNIDASLDSIFDAPQAPEMTPAASLDSDFDEEPTFFRTDDGKLTQVVDVIPAYLQEGGTVTDPDEVAPEVSAVPDAKKNGRKSKITQAPATPTVPPVAPVVPPVPVSPQTANGVVVPAVPRASFAPLPFFGRAKGSEEIAKVTQDLEMVMSLTLQSTMGTLRSKAQMATADELIDLDRATRYGARISFRGLCLVREEIYQRIWRESMVVATLPGGVVDEEQARRYRKTWTDEVCVKLNIKERTFWEDAQIQRTFFGTDPSTLPITDYYGNTITTEMMEDASNVLDGKTFFLKALLVHVDEDAIKSGDTKAKAKNPLATVLLFAEQKRKNNNFTVSDAESFAKMIEDGLDPLSPPEKDDTAGTAVVSAATDPAPTQTTQPTRRPQLGVIADINSVSPDAYLLMTKLYDAAKNAKSTGQDYFVRLDSAGHWNMFPTKSRGRKNPIVEFVVAPNSVRAVIVTKGSDTELDLNTTAEE